MAEMIHMTHPTVDGVATATPDAFERVWKPKGWVLADAKALVDAEKAELAQALGVDVKDLPKESQAAAAAAAKKATGEGS